MAILPSRPWDPQEFLALIVCASDAKASMRRIVYIRHSGSADLYKLLSPSPAIRESLFAWIRRTLELRHGTGVLRNPHE